jgi:hypothetical protein
MSNQGVHFIVTYGLNSMGSHANQAAHEKHKDTDN